MQISGQSAPDLFCTDASYIDWDVACWKSDVGTPLIKNWSKLAGSSLKIRVITLYIGLHGCSLVCLELALPV